MAFLTADGVCTVMESMRFSKKLFVHLLQYWAAFEFTGLACLCNQQKAKKKQSMMIFTHYVVCHVACYRNVINLNRQCCLHPNTLRCFTVIHKRTCWTKTWGHSSRGIAFHSLWDIYRGVYTSVNRSTLPQVPQPWNWFYNGYCYNRKGWAAPGYNNV